jgi:hypothetical protein
MPSTYSNLKFQLIGNGEESGFWGNITNTNIGTAIEQAIVGMATLTSGEFTANVATLTLANTNAAQNARALCLNIAAGAVSAAGTINVPAIQKPYIIINDSSFAVTVKVSGLTGVAVPAGRRTVVYNNGTDVGEQVNYLTNLALGTALPAASGGTGATSLAAATIATYAGTETLTNKRITQRIGTIASASTITPTSDLSDQYNVTALAVSATIAAPSGTPTDGQKLVLRFKDNGTARALTWTTTSGAYRAVGVALPTSTASGKILYIGCLYNAADAFWDVVAFALQA